MVRKTHPRPRGRTTGDPGIIVDGLLAIWGLVRTPCWPSVEGTSPCHQARPGKRKREGNIVGKRCRLPAELLRPPRHCSSTRRRSGIGLRGGPRRTRQSPRGKNPGPLWMKEPDTVLRTHIGRPTSPGAARRTRPPKELRTGRFNPERRAAPSTAGSCWARFRAPKNQGETGRP